MNDHTADSRQAALLDELIQWFTGKLDELERKQSADAEQAKIADIPPDVPRFVTLR